ncbi:acyltransferase family protein [Actinoalloteichus sp. AHMU CJ021]|uniref:acyltransferase family protein n=1 Tax=Actinoalloteichus sp. AHMU CJ021 TaxID=2072503 RepID=UPI00307C4D6C
MKTTRSPRRISWDVLRVIAVLAVVFQHATHQVTINHPELGDPPFRFSLQIGAATLLTISAFFVCETVRRGNTPRWWWNRVARLLPAYVVAVLFTWAAFAALAPADWYVPTPWDVAGNLLLLQSWLPSVHYVDGAYWTLPVQLMAFTAAALLWPRGRWNTWHAPALIWAVVLVPLGLRLLYTPDSPQWFRLLFDGLGLHRAHLFAAGAAIWFWSRRRLGGWHLTALLGVLLVAHEAHSADLASTVAFGVLLVLISLAAGGPDWDNPVLMTFARPIRWIGGISFGVYLLNQEVGYLLSSVLLTSGVTSSWVRLAAVVAQAILLGWLLTKLVERPAHRWLTRRLPELLRSWRGSSGPAPVPAAEAPASGGRAEAEGSRTDHPGNGLGGEHERPGRGEPTRSVDDLVESAVTQRDGAGSRRADEGAGRAESVGQRLAGPGSDRG